MGGSVTSKPCTLCQKSRSRWNLTNGQCKEDDGACTKRVLMRNDRNAKRVQKGKIRNAIGFQSWDDILGMGRVLHNSLPDSSDSPEDGVHFASAETGYVSYHFFLTSGQYTEVYVPKMQFDDNFIEPMLDEARWNREDKQWSEEKVRRMKQ